MLPSGFEPESKAREALMIGRYTTGARKMANKEVFDKVFASSPGIGRVYR